MFFFKSHYENSSFPLYVSYSSKSFQLLIPSPRIISVFPLGHLTHLIFEAWIFYFLPIIQDHHRITLENKKIWQYKYVQLFLDGLYIHFCAKTDINKDLKNCFFIWKKVARIPREIWLKIENSEVSCARGPPRRRPRRRPEQPLYISPVCVRVSLVSLALRSFFPGTYEVNPWTNPCIMFPKDICMCCAIWERGYYVQQTAARAQCTKREMPTKLSDFSDIIQFEPRNGLSA